MDITMNVIYLYELPTTGAILFSDFCADQTVNKAYGSRISEVTEARANLRGALKESKRADHTEKDYLKLVKVLDEYLPQLRSIMNCVVQREIVLKSEPIFSWRTTLSSNLFNTSPRLSLRSLHADYASSLLTYAFALSNLARSAVISLGAYERERAISDAERRAKDEKLNFAVTLLCRASGVFSYLSDTVLREWEESSSATVNKPPDLSREVNSALAKMSIADAQTLAIRKLLSKATYDSTLTPGPPLPKSHPSPALIAKLHLECASLYSSARLLTQNVSSQSQAQASSGDIRRYLGDSAAFHSALARKWLGVDAGENGGNAKAGEAIAWLLWAKKELEEAKDSARGVSVSIGGGGREKERKSEKERIVEELETVNVFLKHYKNINDSLTFQPVPPQMDLQAQIPAGRLAVAVKPFIPPVPAFGPGSVDYLRSQAEALESDGSREGQGSGGHELKTETLQGTYAGAGSYF